MAVVKSDKSTPKHTIPGSARSPSENAGEVFQVIDFVGHRFLVLAVVRVKEYGIEAGHARAGDVRLGCRRSSGFGQGEAHFFQREIKKSGARAFGACPLRSDNPLEVMVNTGSMHLVGL